MAVTRKYTETVAKINKMADRRVREWEKEVRNLRKHSEISTFRAGDMVLQSITIALRRVYALGVR